MRESTKRQKSRSSGLLALLMLGLAALSVRGAVVLLDAETDQDMAAWSGLDRVMADRVPHLPMRGAGSARLQVAPAGSRRVEIRHAKVPVADWRSYDRLVVDVLNDGSVSTLLRIEVNSAANEAQLHFALPAGRWVRIEIPTTQIDPEADLSRVRDIQIAVHRQAQPLVVYLDNMLLLSPGETMPEPSATFLSEAVRRLRVEVEHAEGAHDHRCAAFTTRRAAVWFARKAPRDRSRSFARPVLLLTVWLYFGLNFAFFDFPWPWCAWTARTSNAILFACCAVGLSVAAFRGPMGSRRANGVASK